MNSECYDVLMIDNWGTYLALNMVARAMKQPSATRGVPVKHLSTVQSNSGPMSGLQSRRSTMVSRASSYICTEKTYNKQRCNLFPANKL